MNIEIRHVEPEDHEALRLVFSGQKAIAGTLQLPFPSSETWRKKLAEPPEGLHSLVACLEGEVIGTVSLSTNSRPRLRHTGNVALIVRDDFQGKGVGSAMMEAVLDLADNWLGLRQVSLNVFVDNAAAIALYEKFGFEIEGTHRQDAFRDGVYVDSYSMARLRVWVFTIHSPVVS
ncbi:MAG: GNAT family N-acetyltransferase [Rubrobacteraceae bacterium]